MEVALTRPPATRIAKKFGARYGLMNGAFELMDTVSLNDKSFRQQIHRTRTKPALLRQASKLHHDNYFGWVRGA
jgi:hypothetical protein